MASGGAYNDRRGGWIFVWVRGVCGEIEAAGIGVRYCGVRVRNMGEDAVVDIL